MVEISKNILAEVIKQRKSNTHKGNYGRVLLIGGNNNYGGAIIMATEGALNSGAGLICVATHSLNVTPLHTRMPEVMFVDWRDQHALEQLIPQMDVIVCGMGLGTDEFASHILTTLKHKVTNKQTLILDASALDLIAHNRTLIPHQAKKIILTPHQMEWQRVSQIRIKYQTNSANLEALDNLLPNKNGILVLKSNHTTIYDQENKKVFVNPLGNPGMATGGMGDTLAGIIGGFCGQFGNSTKTIEASVLIHSLAGDEIYHTDYVVRPTKLSSILPQLMKKYSIKIGDLDEN